MKKRIFFKVLLLLTLVGIDLGYSVENNVLGYGAIKDALYNEYSNDDPRLLNATCVPVEQHSKVYEYLDGNLQMDFSQAYNQLGIDFGAKGTFAAEGTPISIGGELSMLNETQTSELTVNYIISGSKVSIANGHLRTLDVDGKPIEPSKLNYLDCGPYFTNTSVGQATALYMVSVKLNSLSDYQLFKSDMSAGIPGILELSTKIKEAAGSTTAGGNISVTYLMVKGDDKNPNLMTLQSDNSNANTFSFSPDDLDRFVADFNSKFGDVEEKLNKAQLYYRIPNKGEKVFISQKGSLPLDYITIDHSGFSPFVTEAPRWVNNKYKTKIANYEALVAERNVVGEIFNTLFKARNDKARLTSSDFQNWLKDNNNTELANKINDFYSKYDSAIVNDNYFSAMKQINNDEHGYPGAEVLRKCYSKQALINGVKDNFPDTLAGCQSAVDQLKHGVNNIVADYKDLAGDLVGYNLNVEAVLNGGEYKNFHLFYAYPIKSTKNGDNIEVVFRLDRPGTSYNDFSIIFPFKDGVVEFSDKVQFNFIDQISGFQIKGSPSTRNTINGNILSQSYSASDGSGDFILQVSKDGPFGLSPFSGN